ncbi:MAG: hypothetical protein Q8M11_19040 [Sulfuritalea sp.]|nr:hypothetical protein [Sulfuritalea sp.]MDP1983381.1 hypothetical protein [Sulfuritalea sp.]
MTQNSLHLPKLARERLQAMRAAGREILECRRVLEIASRTSISVEQQIAAVEAALKQGD